MTQTEDTPNPQGTPQDEGIFAPAEPVLPENPDRIGGSIGLAPSQRRRRSRRYFVTPDDDERSRLLENLARRAFPSFEFFLFALLGGLIMGAGFILDSQALLLLGILLAPLMTPWVGMVLGIVTGSGRFFLQTTVALLAASLIIFLAGLLAGLAARLWVPLTLFQANIHSHLWWPNFLLLTLGAVLMVYSFTRSDARPIIPSVMLAYGLFLPLSASGFGLGSATPRVWPDGILVCLVHLALVTLLGGIVLAALRFRPSRPSGYLLTTVVGLFCLAALVVFTGLGNLIVGLASGTVPWKSTSTVTPPALPSVTTGPSRTPTLAGPSRTPTSLYSPTATLTLTSTPTPSYAIVNASVGGGALVRAEPGIGAQVTTLLNGTLVQVLPEIQDYNGRSWVHIRTLDGIEGWVLQSVLSVASPPPTPIPTLTPTT